MNHTSARRPSRRSLRVLLAGTALAACVAATAAPASADTIVTRACPEQVAPCTLSTPTISGLVRGVVDKSGSSPVPVTWTLTLNGLVVCRGSYRPVDPPVAFACLTHGRGTATVSTPGHPGATRITLQA